MLVVYVLSKRKKKKNQKQNFKNTLLKVPIMLAVINQTNMVFISGLKFKKNFSLFPKLVLLTEVTHQVLCERLY